MKLNCGDSAPPVKLVLYLFCGLLLMQMKDCNVVASKLILILDDLLWVLTDSQLKAMVQYAKSLSEAMEKSAQQRKSMAAEEQVCACSTRKCCEEKFNIKSVLHYSLQMGFFDILNDGKRHLLDKRQKHLLGKSQQTNQH